MKNLFKKIAILSVAMLVFGCSEDGATGATGATGANGINGTNGTNGTNGQDGNANVTGIADVTTTSTSWTPNGTTFWSTTIQIPEITQAVFDRGIVSVFRKFNSGIWNAIPYSYVNVSWNHGFFVGGINIFCSSVNGNAINDPAVQNFRVVIITPSNRLANPDTNWNNYDEVKTALKLKD
jgi:hypothetical protein